MFGLLHRPLIKFLFAIAVLLMVVAWMAGSFRDKVGPGERPDNKVTGIEPYVVTEDVFPIIESTPAGITARDETTIASRLLGQIKQVHVRAGDKVNKGEVLVSLDTEELEANLSQAEARVSSLQARVAEAENNLKRVSDLRTSGLASNTEFDRAKAEFNSLSSQLNAAKQASVSAITQLSYASITAPIDGTVIDRLSEPGDMAQVGIPLLSLYDAKSLQVEAFIRESLVVKLEVGQSVTVFIEALGQNLSANIVEIIPAADPASRNFMVKASIEGSQNLMPGMYAKLLIDNGSSQKIFIPGHYIKRVGQISMVWRQTEQGAQIRYIRTGTTNNGNVEVISGLTPGDQIVLLESS